MCRVESRFWCFEQNLEKLLQVDSAEVAALTPGHKQSLEGLSSKNY